MEFKLEYHLMWLLLLSHHGNNSVSVSANTWETYDQWKHILAMEELQIKEGSNNTITGFLIMLRHPFLPAYIKIFMEFSIN